MDIISRRYFDVQNAERKTLFDMSYIFRPVDNFMFIASAQSDEDSEYKIKSYLGGRFTASGKIAKVYARLWSTGLLETSVLFNPMIGIRIAHSAQIQLKKHTPDSVSMGIGFLVDI